MSRARVSLALADDQSLIRCALRNLLERLGGIDVVIEARDGQELLESIARSPVQVVLADIRMPRLSGIDAVRRLRQRGDATPTILLTTFDEPGLMFAAIAAGAQGYILKDAEPDDLGTAIARVAEGGRWFEPVGMGPTRRALADETPLRLTERELSVLRLVAGGYSNKEIGRALAISDGTVKNHMTDILARLGRAIARTPFSRPCAPGSCSARAQALAAN